MVPEPLWERVNAVDSNGYVIASIVGPPIAAALVGIFGGPVALLAIGVAFGIAAVALIGVPDPAGTIETTGRVLADAWAGVKYTWNNRTLRGLGFSITFANLCHGMIAIVLPLIILQRFELEPVVVGLVFAVSGISGVISSFAFGRMDTRGREWALLVWPMVALVADGRDPARRHRAGIGLGRAGARPRRDAPRRRAHRADGHRAVHGPPATDRSGLDGPGVRRVDGLQLPRRAVRRRPRRAAGGVLDRAGDHRPRDRRIDPRRTGCRVPRSATGHRGGAGLSSGTGDSRPARAGARAPPPGPRR